MPGYGAQCLALSLPDSLWVDILSRLNGQDLARALCTCRGFARLQQSVYQASCSMRFPHWSPYLETECHWRRQYELLCLRDLAERTTTDTSHWRQIQHVITERHRAVLVEWICEIALDWNVESAVSCKAVSYLDRWLCKHSVDRLDRFQLIGIACLRTALGDMRRPTALVTDKHMDAGTFAYLSDNTYSEEEVEAMTQEIMGMIDDELRVAPNAKMFLRTYWYRAIFKDLVRPEEMHVYVFASFLLQLGLLDLTYCGYSASMQGAAALSLALKFWGNQPWPTSLEQYACHSAADLAEAIHHLEGLQATLQFPLLREKWLRMHACHGYDEFGAEWNRLLLVLSAPRALDSVPDDVPPGVLTRLFAAATEPEAMVE